MSPSRLSTPLELQDIQGLIASGYAERPVAAYALFEIADVERARAWLGELASRVQSAEFLYTARDQEPLLGSTCLNVAFTLEALRLLGLPRTALGGFQDSFREGMAAAHRSRQLGDDGESAPAEWHWGGSGTPPVHGVLCGFTGGPKPAASDPTDLEQRLGAELVAQNGVRLVHFLPARRSLEREYRREHFGFRDGISNPAVAGLPGEVNRVQPLPAGEFVLGYANTYGKLPLTPRVPADSDPRQILPHAVGAHHLRDFGKNGSYLVFRQLEQNVALFWSFARAAAARLPDDRSAVWLASRMVGRWPDGTPLTLQPDRDLPGEECDENGFRFADHEDAFGSRCPIGSHIRRTNPRDTMLPLPHDPLVSSFPRATETDQDRVVNVNRHRILRRGRLYGEPLDPHLDPDRMTEDDGVSRGLFFLCFNSNLKRQFEFVQSTWCVNPGFAGLSADPDPLLAASRRHPYVANHLTLQGGPDCPARRIVGVPRFVEVRGGAYFFMPSVRALRYLATNSAALAP